MTTGHFPAEWAASVRRQTHASFIVCALFVATWAQAAPAQNTPPPFAKQRLRISNAAELAGRHAGCVSPSSFCSTWRIR